MVQSGDNFLYHPQDYSREHIKILLDGERCIDISQCSPLTFLLFAIVLGNWCKWLKLRASETSNSSNWQHTGTKPPSFFLDYQYAILYLMSK